MASRKRFCFIDGEAGAFAPEPCFANAASFPAFGEVEPPHSGLLPDNDPGLPNVARSSSVASPAGTLAQKGRGRTAIAISVAFHVVLLLLFAYFVRDAARIAGGEQAGVLMLGSADQDQRRSGETAEPNVTHVSLIAVSKAKPVETAMVAPEAAVEARRPVDTVEAVQPSHAVAPLKSAPLEPAVAAGSVPPAQTSNDIPPILATDQATAATVREAVEASRETETTQAVLTKAESSTPTPALQPAEEAKSEQPVEPTENPPLPRRVEELPSPAKREKPAEKHAHNAPAKSAKHPEQAEKGAPSGGSRGKGSADQSKGRSDGAENGRQAAAARVANASAEGNAAISNYPGKIVRKLRHALRYPRSAGGRKLRGVAQVSFVISSGGEVGGIRLVASSGSPILDHAALDAVRRAAPFPPIPAEAGRSSWPFTVPLAFVR